MSVITSQQLVDALVVVKTEQNKVDCHRNLTMSLENAKKRQYEKRIAKVNLFEINENGVIKKIMFPANAVSTTASNGNNIKLTSKSRIKKVQSVPKVNDGGQSNIQSASTSQHLPTSSSNFIQNFTIAPKASNSVNVPIQLSQPSLVNKPLIINGISNSTNIQNPQTIILNSPSVNGINQLTLQPSPVIIQQPALNSGFKQNVVFQSQNNQQMIQVQNGNFQINNNNNQYWIQNPVIQSPNGQLLRLPNTFVNNNTIQYQVVNQQGICNPQNLNPTNSNPIMIQPQMANNAVVVSPNNQKTLFFNQQSLMTSHIQNIQQPGIITINANTPGNNQAVFQVNNVQTSVLQQPQQSMQTLIVNNSGNLLYSFNPPQQINTNSNVVISTSTAPQMNNQLVFPSPVNQINCNKSKSSNHKKVAIPKLGGNLPNNKLRIDKSNNCNSGNNSELSNNWSHMVRLNPGQTNNEKSVNVIQMTKGKLSTTTCKETIPNYLQKKTRNKKSKFHKNKKIMKNVSQSKRLTKKSLSVDSDEILGVNSSVEDGSKMSIINKQVPIILLNQLSSNPGLNKCNKSLAVHHVEDDNNCNNKVEETTGVYLKRAMVKQNANAQSETTAKRLSNEEKQMEALKSFRLIKPKPTTTLIQGKVVEVSGREDNEINVPNSEESIPAKRKNLNSDNDLAIAQMLSNEDSLDDLDDLDDCENKQRTRKGNKKLTSSDKSYKCKKALVQGQVQGYPRTRSSTKLNKSQ